jgi:hypothetical protein
MQDLKAAAVHLKQPFYSNIACDNQGRDVQADWDRLTVSIVEHSRRMSRSLWTTYVTHLVMLPDSI